MSKKKIFKWLAISAGVLSLLAVLVVVNINRAYSDSKNSEKQLAVQALAIKTFDIDTNKVKPLFSSDIFDDKIATENSDIRGKSAMALVMLTKEGVFKPGDLKPTYFLEGTNKVSIAIKHSDGSISLDKFDISGNEPVKIDHKVKGVE